MPKRRTPRIKPPSEYHHGDLRETLIQAARDALRTQPLEDVTLKSLALRLGVSQPAPYRHFETRSAFLEAVAADGYVRFKDALSSACAVSRDGHSLRRLLRAHVDFGFSNIGVYRLMFSRPILGASPPSSVIAKTADASFTLLVSELSAHVGEKQAPAAALSAWAMVHGIVTLTAEGMLSGPLKHHSVQGDIVDSMIDTLLRGVKRRCRAEP